MRPLMVLLAVSALASCRPHPARYADALPVAEVADDRPIPVPRHSSWIEPVAFTEAYVRRPLVDALDASRIQRAQDVNAWDEVPLSSWWQGSIGDANALDTAYAGDGPPVPPLRIVRSTQSFADVEDDNGHSYRLAPDPADKPHTASAAAVIGSRLLFALGYRTPQVWVVPANAGEVVGKLPRAFLDSAAWRATRWPIGIDLGPTPPSERRRDDPNDRVEPTERRTLRVLGIVAAWLDIGDFGPAHLRDIYVGAPGRGHVQHFVVGLESAVGVRHLSHADGVETAAGTVRGDPFTNLVTLGLYRPEGAGADRRSLRVLSPSVDGYDLGMPFDPIDHLLPGDAYWISKQLARLSPELITHVVAKARIADPNVARHVAGALDVRRRALLKSYMMLTTPCDLDASTESLVVLTDRAVQAGLASSNSVSYRAELFDAAGRSIAPLARLTSSVGDIELPLPRAARIRQYVIARVQAEYPDTTPGSPVELHLSRSTGVLRVVGIRH